MSHDRSHALDHVVLVLFENRSIDNLLGHLYGPEDGKTFEGVIGKDLSNPIPEWAEHGAERKTVPYTVTTDMDAPNPDSGEDQRLEAHGRTWKIYVQEPSPISGTALVHMPQMKDRLATNILPFSEFEQDAANGTLPHFSMDRAAPAPRAQRLSPSGRPRAPRRRRGPAGPPVVDPGRRGVPGPHLRGDQVGCFSGGLQCV